MADSTPIPDLRCPHFAGPLTKEMETSEWTIAPFIRDSFSMIGTAVGGAASAFHGFNRVMPIVQKGIKGPMWLQFLVGVSIDELYFTSTHFLCFDLTPPVIVFSAACAGLAGGAVPALAQLASSSYHAAFSTPLTKDDQQKMRQKSRTKSAIS